MNPVAQQLTGWTLEEAKGKPLETVFRAVDERTREAVTTPDGEAHEKGPSNYSLLIARDGTEYLIDQSAAPIRNASGEVAGVVVVFRDVTDLRRRDAALMAHEKLAIAGRLSASIAHEIHNPLDSVANLHYLMANETDPALQQRYLGMAQQELNRTLQISRAMLGLYREPKAPVEEKKSPVLVCPSCASLFCFRSSGRMWPELLLCRAVFAPQRNPQSRSDCCPESRRSRQRDVVDRRRLLRRPA